MIAIATLALSMGSCGGSKNAASMKNESLVEMTISQQMAEDRPATRAWGEGTNFNQSFAKTYAETQARAAFARMLSSKVTTASRQANDAAQQYSSDGKRPAGQRSRHHIRRFRPADRRQYSAWTCSDQNRHIPPQGRTVPRLRMYRMARLCQRNGRRTGRQLQRTCQAAYPRRRPRQNGSAPRGIPQIGRTAAQPHARRQCRITNPPQADITQRRDTTSLCPFAEKHRQSLLYSLLYSSP